MNRHTLKHVQHWIIGCFLLVAPLALSFFLSAVLLADLEKDEQISTAKELAHRATSVLDRGLSVIGELEEGEQDSPCSPRHIQLMFQKTFEVGEVREYGRLEIQGGKPILKCTSWGLAPALMPAIGRPDSEAEDIKIWLNQPTLISKKPSLIVQKGSYNALLDPALFMEGLKGMRLTAKVQEGVSEQIGKYPMWVSLPSSGGAYGKHWRKYVAISLLLGLSLGILLLSLWATHSHKYFSRVEALKRSIRSGRGIHVAYQPIIALSSGLVVGCEALVRWQDEKGKRVSPAEFIPEIEKSGIANELSCFIAQTSIKELADVLRRGGFFLSINTGAADFKNSSLISVLVETCKMHKVPTSAIILELTEREPLNDRIHLTILEQVRKAGFRVALDDFGEGNSNVGYLHKLSPEKIKIDKSFVDSLKEHGLKASFIPQMIGMAKTINATVVAEGIETKEQAEELLSSGVDFGQGWFWSKALRKEELVKLYWHRDSQYVDKQLESHPPAKDKHDPRDPIDFC